eukprot:jgi/Astpho2/5029/Aster-x0227
MLCSLPCQGKFEREAAELKENSAQAMKEQGDTLLRQGNFEGAVNAYDRALDLDGSLTPVLGNRAICKLKLKQYRGCVEDCTSALEQIRDPSKPMEACEATGRSLVRLLVRRASAFMELQLYSRTAADYREALRWDSGNSQLAADLEEVQQCMRPLDAATLRQAGQRRFKLKARSLPAWQSSRFDRRPDSAAA